MRKYLAFAQSGFQTQLAYRNQVWAIVFGRVIQVVAWTSLWIAIFQDRGSVAGVNLIEMITYASLGVAVIGAWDWRRILNTVGDAMRTGDVSVYLIKPIHYPLFLLSHEAGVLFCRLIFAGTPLILLSALTYGVVPPFSTFHAIMFLWFFAVSFLIAFLLAVMFGLASFWLLTTFSLEWMLQGLLTVTSGTAIPLWFFPDTAAGILRFLPFAWIGYHPLSVYLGKAGVEETVQLALAGGVWVVILGLATLALWRCAALRITVHGG